MKSEISRLEVFYYENNDLKASVAEKNTISNQINNQYYSLQKEFSKLNDVFNENNNLRADAIKNNSVIQKLKNEIEYLKDQQEKIQKKISALNGESKRKLIDDEFEYGQFVNHKRYSSDKQPIGDLSMDFFESDYRPKILDRPNPPKFVGFHVSRGSANGRAVYKGPRNGYFYIMLHNDQRLYVPEHKIRFC